MGGTHISLKDIAKEAGVHASTVSLCLNDSPLVAEKTRDRVRQIAKELGYNPHPYLKALMRERRARFRPKSPPRLAFASLFPELRGWEKRTGGIGRCLEAAKRQARSRGFRLEEICLPLDRFSADEVAEKLKRRGISGVLLAPLPEPRETLDWPWEQLAVVAIGPSLRDPRLHRVRSNHFEAMTTAMDECHRLGYKRVGLALREEVNRRMDYRWLAAYLARQRIFGIPGPRPLLSDNWEAGTFLNWLAKEKPDAIITTHPSLPAEWLRSAGFSIPADIGLVSPSVISIGARQSGIYEHWEIQGERAVSILSHLVFDNELGLHESPSVSLVDTTWNPGQTLRPR